MRKMHKIPCNNSHTQYVNHTSSHLSISTMDIKEECTNYANLSSTIDTTESIFTLSEMKNEPHNGFTESTFEGVKVKEEPDYNDTEDEDSLDNVTNEYGSQLQTNTIIKEEIIIECEPDVDVSEVCFVEGCLIAIN